MDAARLNWLTATQAAKSIAAGALSAEDYVQACIARIREAEASVQAWAYFDPEFALTQAREADLRRAQGMPVGPLHGIPVGLKDIIDTQSMPTEDGTVLHAGRQPRDDAAIVRMLQSAGAVLMGKTVTTELATYAPGKTRNPHDAEHTPGGSSSGSAAAVAAGMVPVAIGTQTNGSVIRPASFCGVFGFKPTFGLIPRTGVLTQSPPLDQIGVFARSIEDVALVAEALVGHDEDDRATVPRARPAFVATASVEPPLPVNLAAVRTPFWDQIDADAKAAFEELVEVLGDRAKAFELPESARQAIDWHKTIMEADLAGSFEAEYERGRDQLSDSLRAQIERGRRISAVDYRKAVARIEVLNEGFAPLFDEFDAIITPATLGTAPRGLESTGNPLMCTLWTLTGMPAISLPVLRGENGLPIGVQMVARRGDDARLLRNARWLWNRVNEASESP
jgi:Asp-tRNA(Asn)/Glu-tRNA(Gln) amidotransferase A subunit family amidase